MRNHVRCVLVVCCLVVLGSSVTEGTLLNLIQRPPDITSGFINVAYNAGTKVFSASGQAQAFEINGAAPPDYTISSGSFSLTATISNAGVMSSGSFTIGGTITALGANTGTLLTGNLNALGFPDVGGDPIEFTFTPTGGDLSGYYAAGPGGIILTSTSFPSTRFTIGFYNDGFGMADTFSGVPEPLTAVGLLMATCGVGLRARKLLRGRSGL